ncbi:MAG: tetratricopeptide repeat protein, partial [Myxococcales bacterium]
MVRTARARYFYSRGKVNEAIREFDLAVQAAPEDPDAAMARARALATARRHEEARQAIDALADARPTDLNVQATQGEIKLLIGDVEGALDAAENVLARAPRHAKALYVRARAVEKNIEETQADPVRAINAYREVIAVNPAQAEALARLWRLYLKRGERNDAMSTLEHLLLLGETTPEEEVELASLYADSGVNAQRGLRLINVALQREPGEPRYLKIKAELEKKAKLSRAGSGPGVQILRGGR